MALQLLVHGTALQGFDPGFPAVRIRLAVDDIQHALQLRGGESGATAGQDQVVHGVPELAPGLTAADGLEELVGDGETVLDILLKRLGAVPGQILIVPHGTVNGGQTDDLDAGDAAGGVFQDAGGDLHDLVQHGTVVPVAAGFREAALELGLVQLEEDVQGALFLPENAVRGVRFIFGGRTQHRMLELQLAGHAFPFFDFVGFQLHRFGRLHPDGRTKGVLRRGDDFYDLLALGAAAGVPGEVEGHLRQDDDAALGADLLAAVGALVDVGVHLDGRCAAGEFETPVLAEPPGVADEEACAVGVALEAVVIQHGVEPEGEGDGAHVEMGIEEIDAKEPAVVGLLGPPAELGGHEQVAPLGGVLHVVVPGEPARPGFEAGGDAEGGVLPEGDVESEVGGRRAGVEEVGPQGSTSPARGRRGGHNARRIRLGAERSGGAAKNRNAEAQESKKQNRKV